MLVLADQFIVQRALRCNVRGKGDNLLVPRHMLHGQIGRVGLSTVRDGLDLDQIRPPDLQQATVVQHLLHVVALHQGQAIHGADLLATQGGEAVHEALPEVLEERPIDFFERLRRRRVNADVQLRDGSEIGHLLRELRVGDQEGANPSGVQVVNQLVDVRVHDRLANQAQGAVSHIERVFVPLGNDTRDALELLDHAAMPFHRRRHDLVRIVDLPAPLSANWILVVPPAEDALVRARERRRHFHALVACDSVEGVFVAAAPPPHLILRPATHLDGAVRPDDVVALLHKRLALQRRDHLRPCVVLHFRCLGRHALPEVFHIQQTRRLRLRLVLRLVLFAKVSVVVVLRGRLRQALLLLLPGFPELLLSPLPPLLPPVLLQRQASLWSRQRRLGRPRCGRGILSQRRPKPFAESTKAELHADGVVAFLHGEQELGSKILKVLRCFGGGKAEVLLVVAAAKAEDGRFLSLEKRASDPEVFGHLFQALAEDFGGHGRLPTGPGAQQQDEELRGRRAQVLRVDI
mmetsp:Transcript_11293/g.42147  ORF Transcript_11293/g.42147 Transcript_11293/m.42147 type:complete len:519 (-) Transcript_11293:298-1854(-)